jgi:hypothetical protein
MRKINISTNKYPNRFALVDDNLFDYLNQWKWGISTKGYVYRKENNKYIAMHRIVNNTPIGYETDHINRDKLDNRKINLRTVTRSQNKMNTGLWKHNKSKYKGVFWDKQTKNWRAMIQIVGVGIHLGRFIKKKDAINARKNAERILWLHK